MDTNSASSASILIIDDDVRLCGLIAEFFAGTGYVIEAVHDGPEGLARVTDKSFDLVLLDVMLPGLDGFEVLTQLRRRSAVPVIMLTARGEQQDRIGGLKAGADDYIPKPFNPEELAARIAAVLRRSRHQFASKPELVSVGKLSLSAATRRIWIADASVDITATEFDILDLLVRAGGRVVSKDEVCAMLYQRPATPFERAIEVHVSRLRRKLHAAEIVIRTIRGAGYVLAIDETP